ncbi:hypothetical protein FB451DRAFT_1391104 [Mycena latifolia]|nr:hypothetical protein FB451DRAFT_1391104 [Mycena latifolia]
MRGDLPTYHEPRGSHSDPRGIILADHASVPSYHTAPPHLKLMCDPQSALLDRGGVRVNSLVARSGCSLRALHLRYTETFGEIHDCLPTLDSLTELDLSLLYWSSDDFNLFLTWLVEDLKLLPALKTLRIHQCQGDIDVSALAKMLAARWSGGGGRTATLETFRLSFTRTCGAEENVENALALLDLRVCGMKIEIQSPPKWATQNVNLHMIPSPPFCQLVPLFLTHLQLNGIDMDESL